MDFSEALYKNTLKRSYEFCMFQIIWLFSELVQFVGADICICVVGNKTDLEDERLVDADEGRKYALDSGNLFMETSALTGEGLFIKLSF